MSGNKSIAICDYRVAGIHHANQSSDVAHPIKGKQRTKPIDCIVGTNYLYAHDEVHLGREFLAFVGSPVCDGPAMLWVFDEPVVGK